MAALGIAIQVLVDLARGGEVLRHGLRPAFEPAGQPLAIPVARAPGGQGLEEELSALGVHSPGDRHQSVREEALEGLRVLLEIDFGAPGDLGQHAGGTPVGDPVAQRFDAPEACRPVVLAARQPAPLLGQAGAQLGRGFLVGGIREAGVQPDGHPIVGRDLEGQLLANRLVETAGKGEQQGKGRNPGRGPPGAQFGAAASASTGSIASTVTL